MILPMNVPMNIHNILRYPAYFNNPHDLSPIVTYLILDELQYPLLNAHNPTIK